MAGQAEQFKGGDFIVPHIEQTAVIKLAELPFGEGKIGSRERLPDSLAEMEFAEQLDAHTGELTQTNLADCIDGRPTLELVDMPDGLLIARRIVPQLPGGTFLAATKATVAAGAQLVSDAKGIQAAYETVAARLEAAGDDGEEDAAHAACGAEEKVQASIENQLESSALFGTFRVLVGDDPRTMATVSSIAGRKRQLLEDGFYSRWDPAWHADYVMTKYPQNYSHLEVDKQDETGGHHEAGLYVVTREGRGFAKNAFIDKTGRQAFAVTVPKMRQLADLLGGSDEEKHRILMAFIDDALHVSNLLVAEHMPVFTDAHEG
jgi:hypothetical protein